MLYLFLLPHNRPPLSRGKLSGLPNQRSGVRGGLAACLERSFHLFTVLHASPRHESNPDTF